LPEIPANLQDRELYKGYVVPFLVITGKDGVPDFKVTNMDNHKRCIEDNLCGLCGKPNDYYIWFIGGPTAIETRSFFDPGMHESCARYALTVCPYLLFRKGYAADEALKDHSDIATVVTMPMPSPDLPSKIGLAKTRGFKWTSKGGKGWHVLANPFLEIEWVENPHHARELQTTP
jgi:hypothetical protein